jgi:hypothetical protein
VKSYDGPVVTTLNEDVNLTEVEIALTDATNIAVDQYIYIDSEEMLVTTVNNNSVVVERARDDTTAASHVKGTSVRVVNPTVADNTVAQDDNALIEEGDDFGFDGVIS